MKQRLLKDYPFQLELHAHTFPASLCSEIPPRELVRVCRERGVTPSSCCGNATT